MSDTKAKIGDSVRMASGSGWGKDGAIGIVTNREVLAGAPQLGELAEVTFPDGFAFWAMDVNMTVIQTK